jgi:hypothetical protein
MKLPLMPELVDMPDDVLPEDEPVVTVEVPPDGAAVVVPVDDGVIGGAPVPDDGEPMVDVVGLAGEVAV